MATHPFSSDCPSPPPPFPDGRPDPDALGFTPFKPMVRWFSPTELVRAGVKALLSSLFGAYADNRELQAIRSEPAPISYAGHDELWIDYTADLGDGWDATYAIARLLAAPDLAPAYSGEAHATRRGRLLVMGGDQVYPTATREEYTDRLAGPYRAALPCVVPEPEAPHLYAVPGNHDWYDGLTSFTRLFCQRRWIGGWKTQQSHSYFALELPHNWWLWGIDVQLGSDIDLPQLRYFTELGRRIAQENGPANIILCTAEPTWVFTHHYGLEAYDNLAKFEQDAIHDPGHTHSVGLAGDLHAYARWHSEDGRQRFISGGGGAYLYPTHQFPETLHLPTGTRIRRQATPGPDQEPFSMGRTPADAGRPTGKAVFPDEDASEKLALRSLLLPFLNPSFAALIGAVYLFLVWLVQSASKVEPPPFLETLAGRGGITSVWGQFVHFGEILAHAPLALLTVLAIFGGLVAFADGHSAPKPRQTRRKVLLGLTHTLMHLVTVILLAWGFAAFNLNVIGFASADALLQTLLFSAEMLTLGSIAGGFVIGLYLYASHALLDGTHANEVLSCQSLPTYKHFLRLHIGRDGGLTIYPIGLRDVPRAWTYRADAAPGEPWFEAEDGSLLDEIVLIEPPIHVAAPAGVPRPPAVPTAPAPKPAPPLRTP